jgi:hypothetical protein
MDSGDIGKRMERVKRLYGPAQGRERASARITPPDHAVDDDRKAVHARHLAGECDRSGRRYEEGER